MEWGKHFFACPHMNNSRGLLILISKFVEIINIEEVACEKYQTRIQILKFGYKQEDNVLCYAYAQISDTEKAEFFNPLTALRAQIAYGGDTNSVFSPPPSH